VHCVCEIVWGLRMVAYLQISDEVVAEWAAGKNPPKGVRINCKFVFHIIHDYDWFTVRVCGLLPEL